MSWTVVGQGQSLPRGSPPRVYSASASSAYDAGGELRIANCHFVLAGHHRDLALARVADVGDRRLRPGDDIGIRLLRDDCADRGHTGGCSRRVLDESTPGDGV